MKFYLKLLTILLFLSACNSDGLQKKDLQSYGANIAIKVPETAEIKSSNIGFRKEITVKDGQYDIVLSVATDVTKSAEELNNNNLESVKSSAVFSRIVEESKDGFIYEINQGDEKNYDFRYVYVKNAAAYHFRRNFVGDFTLDEVKTMYKAVQQ